MPLGTRSGATLEVRVALLARWRGLELKAARSMDSAATSATLRTEWRYSVTRGDNTVSAVAPALHPSAAIRALAIISRFNAFIVMVNGVHGPCRVQ